MFFFHAQIVYHHQRQYIHKCEITIQNYLFLQILFFFESLKSNLLINFSYINQCLYAIIFDILRDLIKHVCKY